MKKSDFIKTYGSDLDLEYAGVWIQVMGIKWKVKRLSYFRNEEYRLKLEALKSSDQTDKEIAERLKMLMRAFAETCVLDWDGLEEDDGSKSPFSTEAVYQAFIEVPDLFETLFQEATKNSYFQKEEDLKNLETASSGTTSIESNTSSQVLPE